MVDRLCQLVLRLRYAVWGVVGLVSLVLWLVTPPIKLDQSVEGFFPDEHPALVSYRKARDVFGDDQLVFVSYADPQLWTPEGMQRVRTLADRIEQDVPGVERVDALDQMPVPWKVDDSVLAMAEGSFNLLRLIAGKATVRSMVRAVSKDPERQAEFRQRICAHPLFQGTLVDRKGTMTSLVVRLKPPDNGGQQGSVAGLRKVADEFGEQERVGRAAVAGPPVLVVDGFDSMERDNRTLGVVAMILMAFTMWSVVRNPAWALLPLISGLATWQITQAFMVYFDLRLSLSTGPIVAQTVVLCMPAASHLAVHFYEVLRAEPDLKEAARKTLCSVFTPVAWCSVSAASGYLATWAVTSVKPVAQFGMTMFVCNIMAGAFAWSLAAAPMTFGFWRTNSRPAERMSLSNRVSGLTEWVVQRPALTLVLFAVPVVLAVIGIYRLSYESNFINVYKPTARVARDYRMIEEGMGGIGFVELVFPVPAELTPDVMRRVKQAAADVAKTDPELISGVASLADVLSIPPNAPETLHQRILDLKVTILSGPSYSHFLTTFWNQDKRAMRMIVRIRENAPAERKQACFEKALAVVQKSLSPKAYVTGLSHLMTQATEAIIVTSSQSALWSGAMSLLMLWLALQRVPLSFLALAPTLMAVSLVLGVMGWLDMKIDMTTALVASVAIGLSVDDAFHCLLRWKSEIRAGQSGTEALRRAYAGTGAGVVLSSTAVSLGFLVLLLSDFVPMANFGWLIAIATLGGSLGNLVVIPAVLALTGSSLDPKSRTKATSDFKTG